ncbi:MAG: TetR/AcrR family transcriptional regulator [Pyrinomonadaceae bacterium MAG19_C2-C3]|nr:TetR/AcrR family transcriptional regulator [Pyrinomonadaceae bacterium MAG19_C2-C3]
MSGEARRQQLIEVAIRLFSQKGFTGTTTKDIATAARVNEAIIFRHFARKEDLYAAILDSKASACCADVWLKEIEDAARRNDDETVFRLLATHTLAHYRDDRDFLRLMLYSALEGHELTKTFRDRQVRPVFEFMTTYIRRRQRAGAFRHTKPSAVVRAFNGMVHHHGLIVALFCPPESLGESEAEQSFARLIEITDEEAIENFTRLILDGLRRPDTAKSTTKTKGETKGNSLCHVSTKSAQTPKNLTGQTKNATSKNGTRKTSARK